MCHQPLSVNPEYADDETAPAPPVFKSSKFNTAAVADVAVNITAQAEMAVTVSNFFNITMPFKNGLGALQQKQVTCHQRMLLILIEHEAMRGGGVKKSDASEAAA